MMRDAVVLVANVDNADRDESQVRKRERMLLNRNSK